MKQFETIKFCKSFDQEYGFLSNFYHSPFYEQGTNRKWSSSELFYQAMKFFKRDAETYEKIYTSTSIAAAVDIGRHTKLVRGITEWERIKEDFMAIAISNKFIQNQDILQHLLATGNSLLIEDSQIDYYWGIGKNGTGENRLGTMLMTFRSFFTNIMKPDKQTCITCPKNNLSLGMCEYYRVKIRPNDKIVCSEGDIL